MSRSPPPAMQNAESPSEAGGLLLVSLCPGGTVSNVYCFLAKADVALSVTLTTINSPIAVVALPILVTTVFPSLLDLNTELNSLVGKQSLQLLLLLVLFGMGLRHFKPGLTVKAMPPLERTGALGLVLLLVAIFIQFKDQIVEQLSLIMMLAIRFSLNIAFIRILLVPYIRFAEIR